MSSTKSSKENLPHSISLKEPDRHPSSPRITNTGNFHRNSIIPKPQAPKKIQKNYPSIGKFSRDSTITLKDIDYTNDSYFPGSVKGPDYANSFLTESISRNYDTGLTDSREHDTSVGRSFFNNSVLNDSKNGFFHSK
jgi:hypothetical protein